MSGELYLQIAGNDKLVLVISNRDGTTTGTYGPFDTDLEATAAKDALLEAGVEMPRFDVLPLRKVIREP